jgi:hypothetical protein
MRRPRPWRAVAYVAGPPRYYFGNSSALTREGRHRSVNRWRELGLVVEVWEVLPIGGVAQLVEQHAATAPSPSVPSPA